MGSVETRWRCPVGERQRLARKMGLVYTGQRIRLLYRKAWLLTGIC